MFDDELPTTFRKMHDFSAADGFAEITESMGDMIKYTANEPSVGLFFVQQHTRNAAPNLLNLKENISEKLHEMALHTEDSHDSIAMVKSMKECGNPIANEMIKDINKSLSSISMQQPRRGLISSPSSSFQIRKTTSWDHTKKGGLEGNYLSSILRSAKERASDLKWAPFDSRDRKMKDCVKVLSLNNRIQVEEADGLPLSSPNDELGKEDKLFPLLERSYDEFKADREAKLEEWLGGSDNKDGQTQGTDN